MAAPSSLLNLKLAHSYLVIRQPAVGSLSPSLPPSLSLDLSPSLSCSLSLPPSLSLLVIRQQAGLTRIAADSLLPHLLPLPFNTCGNPCDRLGGSLAESGRTP